MHFEQYMKTQNLKIEFFDDGVNIDDKQDLDDHIGTA